MSPELAAAWRAVSARLKPIIERELARLEAEGADPQWIAYIRNPPPPQEDPAKGAATQRGRDKRTS